jgi:hypothetical protein
VIYARDSGALLLLVCVCSRLLSSFTFFDDSIRSIRYSFFGGDIYNIYMFVHVVCHNNKKQRFVGSPPLVPAHFLSGGSVNSRVSYRQSVQSLVSFRFVSHGIGSSYLFYPTFFFHVRLFYLASGGSFTSKNRVPFPLYSSFFLLKSFYVDDAVVVVVLAVRCDCCCNDVTNSSKKFLISFCE